MPDISRPRRRVTTRLGNRSVNSTRRRWYALGLLCTASFMVIMDGSIVFVALPAIKGRFSFSTGTAQWVATAYLVTFGGLLLLGGRAADLLGRRRVFTAGAGILAAASLLCGLARSGDVLIAARAIQGMSAAIMAPTALSILMTTFDEGHERNKALGIWSAVGGMGGTAGSLIGGPLTDGLGWEWIFYINVPVGVAMLALGPVLLRERRDSTRVRSFDLAGAVTISAALALLVYGVVLAPDVGWASAHTTGLLAAAVALGALFVRIEMRAVAPLMPLRIFRSQTLVGGNLVIMAIGMTVYGAAGFTLTQYAQQVLGYSAVQFGLMSAAMALLAVVGSIAGQTLVTRHGPRPVAAASLLLLGCGCLALAQVAANGSQTRHILLGLLIFGPGLGAGFVAGSIAALSGIAEQDAGLTSGLTNTFFQIGGALGIAILASAAGARTRHLAALAGVHPPSPYAVAQGFRTAFLVAVGFAVLGLLASTGLLRPTRQHDRPDDRPDDPAPSRVAADGAQVASRPAYEARAAGNASDTLPTPR
jgi:EmrB/QacA subfamily drug resistance transporter